MAARLGDEEFIPVIDQLPEFIQVVFPEESVWYV
jgi:hypothetical protein